MSFLGGFSDFPNLFALTPYSRNQYLFEIRDADGVLIRYLRDLTGAQLETTLRGPARLTLQARLDNPSIAALAGWNEIWIRRKGDSDSTAAVVVSETRENPAQGDIEIVAHDALYGLTVERVRDYEATATVAEHVADWFAAQESTRPLTIGGIDAAIGDLERTWEVSETDTILHVLSGLEATLPTETMWYVDPARRFWWAPVASGDENQLIVGRNCLNAEREVRNSTVATRVWAFGANEGGRRVRLTDGDAEQDYVEDPLSRWRYSRQMLIDYHDVTPSASYAGQADAVVGLSLSADDHISVHAQSDASDLAVYWRGTKLGHEITGYQPETGGMLLKFGPLDLSAIRDTVVYLYYGGVADSGDALPSDTLDATVSLPVTLGSPISQPGTVPGEIVRPQIVDPGALLTAAQEALDDSRLPEASYRVTLADLEALKRHPATQYTLGRLQHVVDVDRGWDVSEAIVRLERNLLNPAEVTVDLGRLYDREPLEVALAEDAEVADDTQWLGADDVIISEDPAEDWPDGTPARLSDWKHADEGFIDGAKVRGLPEADGAVHGHRIARVHAVDLEPTRYTVEIWTADGTAAETPQRLVEDCVTPDGAALAIGAMVWVYLPTGAAAEAGAAPVIVTGAVHGHRIARVHAVDLEPTRYTVEIWTADGTAAETPQRLVEDCVTPDGAALAIGAMVWVYLPTEAAAEAGAAPVIVTGASNAAEMFRHSHSGDTDGGYVAAFTGLF
jgi:hypothetical protein